MDLKVFDGQDKSELSMVEVAHAILNEHGKAMSFVDLTNEIQQYLGKSDEEIRERLSQFYTDLNIDGSFISLGDNTWGLRSWYPYESIDEATVGDNDEEERPKKKRRKVNAFLAGTDDDDDVIDYDNDDPEDDDLDDTDDDNDSDDDYDEDNPDDDNDLGDDNLEDQLTELHNDADDDSLDDGDEE